MDDKDYITCPPNHNPQKQFHVHLHAMATN